MRRILSSFVVVLSACAVPQAGNNVPELASSREALSSDGCPASVPAALAPAADQELFRIFPAEGVQIYRCTAGASGTASWVFDSPDALLLANNDWDDEGERRIVGHHYAGPTWEYKDHSTIVGKKAAAATVDPTAIPWLLLTAASHGATTGLFTDVTTVQRLETTGGLAPAAGCDATTIGAVARVPYTATYFMYRTRNGDNSNKQCL
jgi:hypothetical protein